LPTRDITSRPTAATAAQTASSLRGIARKGGHLPRRTPPAVVLRLAIGREGIGLELEGFARVACARVTQLTASLPGMRFPVDVSGGVARFRHRWSELQRLELEVGARALERWAAPRLRGLVGARTPDVWIAVAATSATVCVSAVVDADERGSRVAPVLAFEVHVLPQGEDLVIVVANARGAELPAPATAMAIGCVRAVVGQAAERRGAEFVFRRPGSTLAQALLPEAGARVPSTAGLQWTAIAASADTWILQAGRDALPAAPSEDAVRAHEVATMLRVVDDMLVDGDVVAARDAYLDALERAPRHGEIARRIIDIDARVTGRAEAALAMIAEAREKSGGGFGVTPGELLLETGDAEAALASLERVGDTEPAPALAARALELAARATRDVESAALWLDRALARAPRSTTARWERVEKRLALGRLEDALADAEHLEALSRGTAAKYGVWLRAGQLWQTTGMSGRAGPLFERALRFAPDEPEALAGLGASLVAEGHGARGTVLIGRALSLAETRGEATSTIALALALALAETLDDLPTAIAHVASIPADAVEATSARGLEGRWRARLGDIVGAGLAFARLRELAAAVSATKDEKRVRPIAALLIEAAKLEGEQRHDALAARRYLGEALRLVPHDREARRLYREVCGIAGRGLKDGPSVEPEASLAASEAFDEPRIVSLDAGDDSEVPASDGDIERAERVEELTRRLHADPRDEATADELAGLLEALGRGHDLLALLSAGLSDAGVARRAVLAPRAQATLDRLACQAEAAGRKEEAALYRDAATMLAR
jgi:cellulose synthase operon protein C